MQLLPKAHPIESREQGVLAYGVGHETSVRPTGTIIKWESQSSQPKAISYKTGLKALMFEHVSSAL